MPSKRVLPQENPNWKQHQGPHVIQFVKDINARRKKRNDRRRTLFLKAHELAVLSGGSIFITYMDDNDQTWSYASDEDLWERYCTSGLKQASGEKRCDKDSHVISINRAGRPSTTLHRNVTIPTPTKASPFNLSYANVTDLQTIDIQPTADSICDSRNQISLNGTLFDLNLLTEVGVTPLGLSCSTPAHRNPLGILGKSLIVPNSQYSSPLSHEGATFSVAPQQPAEQPLQNVNNNAGGLRLPESQVSHKQTAGFFQPVIGCSQESIENLSPGSSSPIPVAVEASQPFNESLSMSHAQASFSNNVTSSSPQIALDASTPENNPTHPVSNAISHPSTTNTASPSSSLVLQMDTSTTLSGLTSSDFQHVSDDRGCSADIIESAILEPLPQNGSPHPSPDHSSKGKRMPVTSFYSRKPKPMARRRLNPLTPPVTRKSKRSAMLSEPMRAILKTLKKGKR